MFKHHKANVIVITSHWARHGAHYLGNVWFVILPMTSCLLLILLEYNLKTLQFKTHLKNQKQAWRKIQLYFLFLSYPACIMVCFDLLRLCVMRQNACAYRKHVSVEFVVLNAAKYYSYFSKCPCRGWIGIYWSFDMISLTEQDTDFSTDLSSVLQSL